MKLIILSCLIATSLGLPTVPSQPEPQARGFKEDIANAASNIAQNYNDIKNEVQNQISNLPQQISDNVVAPIQQAVGPITEDQNSYHITFVVPKPQLPSWFPSLPPSSTIQMGSLSDYLPNFLKPRGRFSSGAYGNGLQRSGNILDNYLEENSAEDPGTYIIIFALPNALTNWFSWLKDTPYNSANDARL